MHAGQQPVLVGVGQLTNRVDDPGAVLEPLEMMERVARRAAEDAEAPRLLAELDSLTVINIICWSYADPPGRLAARLGARPRERLYSGIGGNTPQQRVNETAGRIARGEVRLALIAGAEVLHGLRLARARNHHLDWEPFDTPAEVLGDQQWGTNDVEQRHHAQNPVRIYPLFENALRAHRGWSIEEHRAHLARWSARLAAVARDNPYAWFRDGKSADEIGTIGPHNRLIAFPYPKFMNAIMDVDQAAALILTSVDTARRLGVPERKWVYLCGSGDANDLWFVSDRVDYFRSPAVRLIGQRALAQAGLSPGQIDYLDLYSCFPSAPQISADMLGIPPDDPRSLTVTGGLPYHGGPGNNYSSHAIATMVERLRAEPGKTGLVGAVGWYMTKHSVGVYSTAPPPQPWQREDLGPGQAALDAEPHPALAIEANGPGTVETYTVVHDREGRPSFGIIVARLGDGRRCWANLTDPTVLERMERSEFVGQPGQLRHHEPTQVNLFEP